jgi:hypothetical protein
MNKTKQTEQNQTEPERRKQITNKKEQTAQKQKGKKKARAHKCRRGGRKRSR